ncbi:MAG: hypothetical protein ACPGJV_09645 [Bacteriovoracaceae bacterium]
MKKIFLRTIQVIVAALLLFALILFGKIYYCSSGVVDWSEEFGNFDIRKDSLVADDRYDYAYVIFPYEILKDRDGVDFSCYYKCDEFTQVLYDEYYLLVFVKDGKIVADALIPRFSHKDNPPKKLFPKKQ